MADIVLLTELKAYLGIPPEDETQDVKLSMILSFLTDWLRKEFEMFGLGLEVQTLTELLNGNKLTYIFTRFRPIVSIATIHQDSHQIFDPTTLIAPTDYRFEPTKGLIHLVNGLRFESDVLNVQVVYDSGFDPIPGDIKLALMNVIGKFNTLSADKGLAYSSERLGQYSYTIRQDAGAGGGTIIGGALMVSELKLLLDHYFKTVVVG